MNLSWTLLVAIFLNLVSATPRHYETYKYYVLEHNTRSATSLNDVVRALGVEVVDRAGELQDHWLVRAPKTAEERRWLLEEEEGFVANDNVMQTFESLKRGAKGNLQSRSNLRLAREIVDAVPYLARQIPRQLTRRAPPPIPPPENPSVNDTSDIVASRIGIRDPLFPKQWHLVHDGAPEHMMNVSGLWALGITGKGVISAIVDDGLDYTSNDLKDNFYEYGSYDFNEHQKLPYPAHSDDGHGTRCAGQIAAVKNDVCGIGIAYDSKVAGLRILSGRITPVDEAAAMNYDYQNTSIYSCSWGPPDNGASMDAPSYLIEKAVVNGINNGRGGKGSIFVFATGNGAGSGDQCNFDGYTNSIYSVTVGAIDFQGLHPYYSEPCAANMIVAYSSGGGQYITTTDKGVDTCATTHGGTSAAAPNAAGVLALALAVRPALTWRDVQHLCVETARQINPEDPDWEKTAQGRPYSYKYGFGAMDGYTYVMRAKDWKLVKPQAWIRTEAQVLGDGRMPDGGDRLTMTGGVPTTKEGVKSVIKMTKAMMQEGNLGTLEHITVKVWITHDRRGEVEVEIVSPKGIKSVLAARRTADFANTGFPGWTFMTVKHWGENPIGDWTIRVSDQGSTTGESKGRFLGWHMTFWGSTIDASKAKQYVVPLTNGPFPPLPLPSEHPTGTPTHLPPSETSHQRPTAALPTDHGEAEGEKHKPAFPTGADDAVIKPSSSTAPIDGEFQGVDSLISDRKWLFATIGVATLFTVGIFYVLWRRRQRKIAAYTALAGESVPMMAVGADGFRDDDGDGPPNLHTGGPERRGLGYHDDFLEDDESLTAPLTSYTDVEEEGAVAEEPVLISGHPSRNPSDADSWQTTRSYIE